MAAAAAPIPLDAKYFDLQFPGINAQFKTVGGIGVTVPLHESQVPDAMGQPQRLRTASSAMFHPVSCASGVTADLGLDTWFKAVADKGIEGNKKDGTLTLFSAANTPSATWTLTGAVISALSVSQIGVGDLSHLEVNVTFDIEKYERTK